MELKVWCEDCGGHQPLWPIKLEVPDGPDCFWGDLVCGTCRVVIATLSAPKKVELKPAEMGKYGCHCDLEPGQQPDSCVMDTSVVSDCVHAMRLSKDGKTKVDCDYWKTIG